MKGVIIAAGYGTRFLPVTKIIPKEMLPIIDIPTIEFTVRELVDSGITDILVVSSRRKKAIEDYFDREIELETVFIEEKATEKLMKLKASEELARFHFLRQQEMKGTAHAILLARSFVGNEPFVVAYPDDFFVSTPPVTKQLVNAYEISKKNVLSAFEVPQSEVSRYGIIAPGKTLPELPQVFEVQGLVEKPKAETTPSNFAALGRYLFLPEIFPLFEKTVKQMKIGEAFQTDAIHELATKGRVVAITISGERFDTGTPLGYLKTLVRFALTRSDLQEEFQAFLRELLT